MEFFKSDKNSAVMIGICLILCMVGLLASLCVPTTQVNIIIIIVGSICTFVLGLFFAMCTRLELRMFIVITIIGMFLTISLSSSTVALHSTRNTLKIVTEYIKKSGDGIDVCPCESAIIVQENIDEDILTDIQKMDKDSADLTIQGN